MRSLVDDDLTLLPQWSTPINVSLHLLPPPEITSSKLLSIGLTSTDVGDFAVAMEVMLSWVEPEDRDELESYEVWIGPSELGEFEQPGEMDGSITEFPVYMIRYLHVYTVIKDTPNKFRTPLYI